MSARLLDGTAISREIRAELGAQVAEYAAHDGTPGLAVVLVGDDPASHAYVRAKARACGEIGIHSEVVQLPSDTTEDTLSAVLDRLNEDPSIDGILCQLPLPPHLDARAIVRRIHPERDVDGFHPVNVGKLALGDADGFKPATPLGVQQLLVRSAIDTRGARVVIVGRSQLVGRPLANLLSQSGPGGDATVTIAHSMTRDLDAVCREADILIVAIGRPGTIRASAIRRGAVVIDVGTSRVEDSSAPRGYRLAGDVVFDEVCDVASAITPVPGGVGPMTIAMLLSNTMQAARLRRARQ